MHVAENSKADERREQAADADQEGMSGGIARDIAAVGKLHDGVEPGEINARLGDANEH
ncbi:MAG: hypothetical protein BWY76_02654 [bacterium ADurb.Bin429]|nr:MAG: hypothetical protein BWY76_02654 [bacterium ADurb.Bin429]